MIMIYVWGCIFNKIVIVVKNEILFDIKNISFLNKMATTTDLQWLQRLRSFLERYFIRMGLFITRDARGNEVIDRERLNKMIDDEAMAIWSKAFTHETLSLTDNYEDLEYLGDAVLKGIFPKYLMERFPHLHKHDYTELNVAFMSKMKQAEIARTMTLGQYVRISGETKSRLNIDADLFESFFGALDQISDLKFTKCYGFAVCYRVIEYLFSTIEIDLNTVFGPAKTHVQQILQRFELGKPEEHVYTVDRGVQVDIVLTPEQIAFFASYNVIIDNPIIGQAIGNTKKEANTEAYNQSLITLHSKGISSEWAKDAKNYLDFSDERMIPYMPRARERLAREGFIGMKFSVPRKLVTVDSAKIQLIGERSSGKEEALAEVTTNSRENAYRDAKFELVKQYAEGRRL